MRHILRCALPYFHHWSGSSSHGYCHSGVQYVQSD